ncbi:MAG TPA: glycosyltransferase [Candidatus Dormibacteraeota bacterium]|nr:glycosyltransferase [Candidatus Dormibacteraeota bacterium]
MVRLHGRPLGEVVLPITGGHCRAVDVRRTIVRELAWPVLRHLTEDRLAGGLPAEGWSIRELFEVPHARPPRELPTVTVAVCTRDRPDNLAFCLQSLSALDPRPSEVLVIDNAPSSEAAQTLVRTRFPFVRYIREPRPGLDWARNRAVLEARGEILAFTDDDCVVDAGWAGALAALFAADPEVEVATGLVVPYELETEAQVLFERTGGFGRGYERKWHAVDRERGLPWEYCGAGQFGTGANMAFRRSVLKKLGPFDPALDVGTVTNGGGDLDMFFRSLVEGHTLVYEPSAVVRHRHRRTYAELRRQIANNGYGFCSVLVRNAMAYPDEQMRFLYLASWWIFRWLLRRVAASLVRPTRIPTGLLARELGAGLTGVFRYQKARRQARKIEARFGAQGFEAAPGRRLRWIRRRRGRAWLGPMAVRTIDVQHPVRGIADVEAYELTRLFVKHGDRLIGGVTIPNQHRPLSALRVRGAIADALALDLLAYTREGAGVNAWAQFEAAALDSFGSEEPPVLQESLPRSVDVSIVIATADRPDGLRDCLLSVCDQDTNRSIEIIVVDNKPDSGLTPAVVAEFRGVKLITERRKGLSYARNAGIRAASGSIVVTTDDDVTMPHDWLERLVAPFVRPDVMIVTGNVLPAELETTAQIHFETYGGLGKGFKRFEVDGDWFESFHWNAAPTWELGATANAAFRAELFADPAVGLFDETLGAGTPTACSEDSYLIYRALKAHHTLVYEPASRVWHHHRRTMRALRRQIYGYSKGHVAYHLTTLLADHDLRSLKRVLVDLPVWRVRQLWSRLRARTTYPTSLVAIEIAGNLVAPLALLRARLRVARWGRHERPARRVSIAAPIDPVSLSEAEKSLAVGR